MRTDFQIKAAITRQIFKLQELEQKIETARLELKQIRERCPHRDKKQWTNDDGNGQFVVERCNVCGAQKDGGL